MAHIDPLNAYSLRVRPVLQRELGQVCQMLRQSWLETYPASLDVAHIHRLSDQWHAPARLERDLAAPRSAFPVVQDLDGRIVGTAYARPTASRTGGPADHVMLHRLYVLRRWQRCGLGRRLLACAARQCPQSLPWRLEVADDNPAAKRFYEHFGFQERHLVDTYGANTAVAAVRLMQLDRPEQLR